MAVDFEIIGKRLKQARKDVKLTQENLGQILNGVSSNSQDYLDIEFYKLLKSCSIENQKLVYDITKLIANKEI